MTYLQRYTLLAATGLAAGGQDSDGVPPGDPSNTIPDEQYVKLRDSIQNANDDDELKRMYRHACAEADRIGDQTSKRKFLEFKNDRYRSLHQ